MVVGARQAGQGVEQDDDVLAQLDAASGPIERRFRDLDVPDTALVEGRAQDLAPNVLDHVRDFLRPLVHEEDQQLHVGVVLLNAVRDRLQQNRLAGPRRRHDESALPRPDGRYQVHDPGRQVPRVVLEPDHVVRMEGRERLEFRSFRVLHGRLAVHHLEIAQSEIALPAARPTDVAEQHVAVSEIEAPDLGGRDVDVVRAGKIGIDGRAEEPEPLHQTVQGPLGHDPPSLTRVRPEHAVEEILPGQCVGGVDPQIGRDLLQVRGAHAGEFRGVEHRPGWGRRLLEDPGPGPEHLAGTAPDRAGAPNSAPWPPPARRSTGAPCRRPPGRGPAAVCRRPPSSRESPEPLRHCRMPAKAAVAARRRGRSSACPSWSATTATGRPLELSSSSAFRSFASGSRRASTSSRFQHETLPPGQIGEHQLLPPSAERLRRPGIAVTGKVHEPVAAGNLEEVDHGASGRASAKTWARPRCPASRLRRLDFPTFDLPTNATSGKGGGGEARLGDGARHEQSAVAGRFWHGRKLQEGSRGTRDRTSRPFGKER